MTELLFSLALTLTMLPLGFFFSCSSCCVCVAFFNEAITTTNFGDFTQVSGTWTLSTPNVRTSDSNAILIGSHDSAGLRGSVAAVFSTANMSGHLNVGESVGMIGGYVDSNNYLLGRVERTNANYHTLELIQYTAGAPTTLESRIVYDFGANSGQLLRLSYTGTEARFCTGATNSTIVADYTPPTGGTKAGMATGTTGVQITFSGYLFTEHPSESATCTECNPCQCTLSAELNCACEIQAEIDGVVNGTQCTNCANVNGTWIMSRIQEATTTCSWYSAIAAVTCAGGVNRSLLQLQFTSSGGSNVLQVLLAGEATQLFRDTSTPLISCNPSADFLTPSASTLRCNPTGATCELNAL